MDHNAYHKMLNDLVQPLTTLHEKDNILSLSDHPLGNDETPTEAHSGLKNLIEALVSEVREDPALQVNK